MPLEDHIALRKSFPFSKLTKLLTGALLTLAALHGVMIGVRLRLLSLSRPASVERGESGRRFILDLYKTGDYVLVAGFLLTALLFLIWFHRARKNIGVLEAEDVGSSPAGAVGWWFVPLAHLFKPYTVARDIWTASNPANYQRYDKTAWLADNEWKPVTLWWTFWLVAQISYRIVSSVYDNAIGIYGISEGLVANVVVDALIILAAWFAVRFVQGVHRRQEERYALIHELPPQSEGAEVLVPRTA